MGEHTVCSSRQLLSNGLEHQQQEMQVSGAEHTNNFLQDPVLECRFFLLHPSCDRGQEYDRGHDCLSVGCAHPWTSSWLCIFSFICRKVCCFFDVCSYDIS